MIVSKWLRGLAQKQTVRFEALHCSSINKSLVLLLLTLLCIELSPIMAQAENSPALSPVSNVDEPVLSSPIGWFQKFISPADGNRCPMAPTCSHYARQAFAQEGVLKGWILTCDRLLRCGRDETRLAPRVYIHGTKYAYDPLEANTFWWKRP